MLNKRRDPIEIAAETVILAADTPEYTFVDRDGAVATAGADAFGITQASGDAGDPVGVTRLGFSPVRIATAAGITGEKQPIAVGESGLGVAVATSGGGTNIVVAVSEEEASADGAQIGAWIDCLSINRSVDVPA